MLTIQHNCGFFSCCSVRLYEIINYFNENTKLPDDIDSSNLYNIYKRHMGTDITFDFFEHYANSQLELEYYKIYPIDKDMFQFTEYKNIFYSSIAPYVKKYFEPSTLIKSMSNKFIEMYQICPENCIAVYYRGTDKYTETPVDSFENFYNKLNEILDLEYNKNIQILIQTDTAAFLKYMQTKCENKNIIIVKENKVSNTDNGIHNENPGDVNYYDIQILFSIILILSKCKYIVCTSGNISIWTLFYRENATNVYQNLKYVWI